VLLGDEDDDDERREWKGRKEGQEGRAKAKGSQTRMTSAMEGRAKLRRAAPPRTSDVWLVT